MIGTSRHSGLDIIIPSVYHNAMTPQDLKEWRSKTGLTQLQLAQKLNVANMTVSRWETGLRSIPPFLFLALQAIECGQKMRKED